MDSYFFEQILTHKKSTSILEVLLLLILENKMYCRCGSEYNSGMSDVLYIRVVGFAKSYQIQNHFQIKS
jgi:hypothetical protein